MGLQVWQRGYRQGVVPARGVVWFVSDVWTKMFFRFRSRRQAIIGGWGKLFLVADSFEMILKLSSRIRLILLFRGWLVRTKGILLSLFIRLGVPYEGVGLSDTSHFRKIMWESVSIATTPSKKEAISRSPGIKSAQNRGIKGVRADYEVGVLCSVECFSVV